MKRVLLLDDDPRRIEAFQSRFGAHCVLTVTETADTCIELLRERPYDLILLDHDLGGEVYCDSSREDCGMEVVRWLARHGARQGAFILHSYNSAGVQLMLAGLAIRGYSAVVAPFGTPEFHQAVEERLAIQTGEDQKKRRGPLGRFRDYFRSLRLRR